MYRDIFNNIDGFLGAYYSVAPLLGNKTIRSISEFRGAVDDYAERLASNYHDTKRLLRESEEGRERILRIIEDVSSSVPEVKRIREEIDGQRKTIAEYVGEGTQAIASIRAANENANHLKAEVEEYSAVFENFKDRLNEREENIRTAKREQDSLIDFFKKSREKIDLINDNAEKMLSGATVAGLAGTFGSIRDDLTKELKSARYAFYFSIFFLLVSVLPLFFYIIPNLSEVIDASGDVKSLTSKSDWVGQLLARVIVLVPAAWFAKFSAARHAALFRLKEHYLYKYSVAVSVEGFKHQAQSYKEEIAATTFFELTENPAGKIDVKNTSERHPNPAMEWFMKKLGLTADGS